MAGIGALLLLCCCCCLGCYCHKHRENSLMNELVHKNGKRESELIRIDSNDLDKQTSLSSEETEFAIR